jgi:hypothetical protein
MSCRPRLLVGRCGFLLRAAFRPLLPLLLAVRLLPLPLFGCLEGSIHSNQHYGSMEGCCGVLVGPQRARLSSTFFLELGGESGSRVSTDDADYFRSFENKSVIECKAIQVHAKARGHKLFHDKKDGRSSQAACIPCSVQSHTQSAQIQPLTNTALDARIAARLETAAALVGADDRCSLCCPAQKPTC